MALADRQRHVEDSASGLNDITVIPFALYWQNNSSPKRLFQPGSV
jgi:hypothetical protein